MLDGDAFVCVVQMGFGAGENRSERNGVGKFSRVSSAARLLSARVVAGYCRVAAEERANQFAVCGNVQIGRVLIHHDAFGAQIFEQCFLNFIRLYAQRATEVHGYGKLVAVKSNHACVHGKVTRLVGNVKAQVFASVGRSDKFIQSVKFDKRSKKLENLADSVVACFGSGRVSRLSERFDGNHAAQFAYLKVAFFHAAFFDSLFEVAHGKHCFALRIEFNHAVIGNHVGALTAGKFFNAVRMGNGNYEIEVNDAFFAVYKREIGVGDKRAYRQFLLGAVFFKTAGRGFLVAAYYHADFVV